MSPQRGGGLGLLGEAGLMGHGLMTYAEMDPQFDATKEMDERSEPGQETRIHKPSSFGH